MFKKHFFAITGLLVLACGVAGQAQTSLDPTLATGAPTDAEATAAFEKARSNFRVSDVSGTLLPLETPEVVLTTGPLPKRFDLEGHPANVAIENVHLVIDVENTTLEDVFGKIVQQAARYTGPWTVKWRLKPENMDVMEERVNLTAEAPFGEFIDLLTERIRNMSGVNLFVTAFSQARVIMITDTYY